MVLYTALGRRDSIAVTMALAVLSGPGADLYMAFDALLMPLTTAS